MTQKILSSTPRLSVNNKCYAIDNIQALNFRLVIILEYNIGVFNNYVKKMGRGSMSVFVHAQGIKTVNAEGGGQKMAKLCPCSF